MNLEGLQKWFEAQTKRINTDKQGAYWLLKVNGQNTFNNTAMGDPSESYNLLEEQLQYLALTNPRSIEVHFRLTKNDRHYNVFPLLSRQSQQGKIAGLPGNPPGSVGYAIQGQAIGQLYEQRIQEREQALTEKYEAKLEQLQAQHQNEKRLQELEDSIMAMRESKMSFADKLLETLEERPAIAEKLIGAVAPGLQGLLGNLVPARSQVAVQGINNTPSVPPAAQEQETASEKPAALPGVDFNPPVQGMINLMQGGFEDAGEAVLRLTDAAILLKNLGFEDPVGTIEELAKFARQNPSMAKTMLSQLPKN